MDNKVTSIMDANKYYRLFLKKGEISYFQGFLDITIEDANSESDLVRILGDLSDSLFPSHKLFVREYVMEKFRFYNPKEVLNKNGFGISERATYCT